MEIEVGFLFDDEGFVLPIMTIDGEPLTESLPAERVARDDHDGLRRAGIDPDDVGRRWDRRVDGA